MRWSASRYTQYITNSALKRMRRFIVIFLLFLLPTQVLAESLDDLRAVQHRIALTEAIDAVSTNVHTTLQHSLFPDASSLLQTVHADISDSVNSATPYVHGTLSAEPWPDYRLITFPFVYLPLIKPPRI